MSKTKSLSSSRLPAALVAGAGGQIGTYLCEALLAQNCRVYAIDNWLSGKKENLTPLLSNKNFVFIEQDLGKSLEGAVPRVDYVFHLAGLEAGRVGKDISLETLLVNSLGTRELLEVAKKNSAKFLLASSAAVFSGFLSSDDLNHYFGQNPDEEEIYSLQEAKRFSEAITFEYANRFNLDARIVRLGFVYGPKMNLNTEGEINRIFLAIKENSPIKIFDQGLTQLYPTFISDVVYGLTKAMFSQNAAGKIFTLINPEKVTVLNLAYQLKKLLPDKKINIEFCAGGEPVPDFNLTPAALNSQTELNWEAKAGIETGLTQTVHWLEQGNNQKTKKPASSEKENVIEPNYSPEELGIIPAIAPAVKSVSPVSHKTSWQWPKIKFRLPQPSFKLSLKPTVKKLSKRNKFILIGAGLALIYLLMPLVLLAAVGIKTKTLFNQAVDLTKAAEIKQVLILGQKSKNNFEAGRRYASRLLGLASLFGAKKQIVELDNLLFIGSKLSQGAIHLAQAGEAGTILGKIIFFHDDGNITQALKEIRLNLDQAYIELSFVESELQSGRETELSWLTPFTLRLQTLSEQLPELRAQINQARLLLPLIPGLIAEDSKKTYLLLFQNSAEIRPTGGFIGSYGLLSMEKGKLLDFSVEDIYAADGQLKGYVQPPKPIEAFLGKNTWFFRDSNWDPDFVVSAQRAEWFLGKTTDRRVDGVFAVNLPAVKELLKATGPIVLSDYNEEVNSDNLFERAEYHSEIDFFPGSTQKRDFLGTLAREIFNRLKNSSPQDLLKMGQAIERSLNQKSLLAYLHDEESQKILIDQNWAGSLFNPNLTTQEQYPVTTDYNYLVEANLGINKANYFLKRNISHQLTILKSREILAVTTIDYQNQSPADTWPGGVYRSYLRQYLPDSATLVSIEANNTKLNLKEVDQERVGDKLVIGFPVTVPVKSSAKVEITYRLGKNLTVLENRGRLAVVVPKQPGIIDDQLEVIVNYPSFLSVSNTKPSSLISPQVVTFRSDLNKDRVLIIDFIER